MNKFLILLLLTLSYAQAEGLNEEMVQQSVLQNFPLIEEAMMKVEASAHEITAAQGDFDTKLKFKARQRIEDRYGNQYIESSVEKMLPVGGLTLFAGHRQGAGVFAPYEGKFNTSASGEIFAGLVIPLLRNRAVDQVRINNRFATIDNEIAKRELLVKQNMYVHKALSTFQKWKLTFLKLETIKGLLKIAEERHQMLERRHRAGDLERIKLTDNLRSINKRKDELLKAEMDFQAISAVLSLYLRTSEGNPIDPSRLLPADKTYRPRPAVSAIDTGRLPQMSIIDMQLEKNRQLTDFHNTQRLPSLNVEALTAREMSRDYPWDPQRVAVGLTFEYPLENRKASGLTTATAYKGQALEKQKAWLQSEFQALFNQTQMMVKIASERTKLTSQELEYARTLAEAERRRWSQGDSDLFIVALREQDAADVEVRLWTAHFEYEQAILDAKLYAARFVVE